MFFKVLMLDNFDKKFNFSDMYNNQFMSDVKIKVTSGQCVTLKKY